MTTHPTRTPGSARVRVPVSPGVTLYDVMADVFRAVFGQPSWSAWVMLAKVLSEVTLTEDELQLYQRITGRVHVPSGSILELWLICGRRAGKSMFVALLAAFLACFKRYAPAPGETLIGMIVAADRKQARVIKNYISGLLHAVPMLAALVVNETRESIELSNGITIEIHTASLRSPRGYTLAFFIGDECAFWPTDDAADPDREILRAVRPALVPGGLLVMLSTPYWRRGELWRVNTGHFGKDDDPVLVVRADSRTMNPTLEAAMIAAAYADDDSAAQAEYGAEFRPDIEAFFTREAIEAVVVPNRFELPPMADTRYFAFTDPSGGSADAFTLAIAHRDESTASAVIDVLREVKPPFSPEAVVADFCALLKCYHVYSVTGDRYGGEWPREQFRKNGLSYHVAERPASDLFRDALPAINAGRVELLDHRRLITQLTRLERRTSRTGKDAIGHPPGPHQHDDLAVAVCGVIVGVSKAESRQMMIVPDWGYGKARPLGRPADWSGCWLG